MMRFATSLFILAALATGAAAQDVDPARKALFVSIVEANGCKMHNLTPSDALIAAMRENNFTREELRAIGRNLMETGEAAREDPYLVLKTEPCA